MDGLKSDEVKVSVPRKTRLSQVNVVALHLSLKRSVKYDDQVQE